MAVVCARKSMFFKQLINTECVIIERCTSWSIVNNSNINIYSRHNVAVVFGTDSQLIGIMARVVRAFVQLAPGV